MYSTTLSTLSRQKYVALVLAVTLLAWSVGLTALEANDSDPVPPAPIELADILSTSNPGYEADHDITFGFHQDSVDFSTLDQLVITFNEHDTDGTNFDLSNITDADITVTDTTGPGAFGTPTIDDADAAAQTITIPIDTAMATSSEIQVQIGGTNKIINPNPDLTGDPLDANTYVVTVSAEDTVDSNTYSHDTRVAIIDDITMTAAIETIFEFSVGGLATTDTDNSINGRAVTHDSTPTSFDFGTITAGTEYFMGHELQVATNASNGFVVTVQESQELTSSTGEQIHRFIDTQSGAVGQAEPVAWQPPAATLDTPETYGHYGITTDDSRLDEVTGTTTDADFATEADGGFVGDFHNEPRPIFGHINPVVAGEQDTGLARVGVALEISTLQAAGDDYTNTLTYVATPTF